MVVISRCMGHRITGLFVGADNVKRYFPKQVTEIELQLDHLRIGCELGPEFWQDQPEICDARLCLWLESKRLNTKGQFSPVPLSMIPSGRNSFIVAPVSLASPSTARRLPAPATPHRAAFIPQPVGDAAA